MLTAELLYCAFEESLLATVCSELEDQLPAPLELRGGLQDHAAAEILKLLFAEVESAGASGRLYLESLMHALAVRFLFLGDGRPAPSGTTTLSRTEAVSAPGANRKPFGHRSHTARTRAGDGLQPESFSTGVSSNRWHDAASLRPQAACRTCPRVTRENTSEYRRLHTGAALRTKRI
jgi:hypothetical protein